MLMPTGGVISARATPAHNSPIMSTLLCQQLPDYLPLYVGQAEIPSLAPIGQLCVVETQALQDRGLQVVNVNFVFDDIEPEVIGFADHLPGADPTARKPHGKRQRMMIAPGIVLFVRPADLDHRRAPELAAPDDESAVEEPALFEVFQQRRRGLVGD